LNPSTSSVSFKEASLTFLFVLLMAIVSLSNLVPPAMVPASAPVTEFSAERAMEHLKVIAREPHPTGSVANTRVRDYLVEQLKSLGLNPEVQRSVGTTSWDIGGAPYSAGTIENVIARWPGTNSTGALLLMAHYDSVATGPGASDNGSGVATLLETLRALRAGPPLRNDVISAFTDGEEDGGLGSQAFVDEYSPAKLVSVALVVDSGGSCGRAPLVVESQHQQNGWLVGQMAKALRHPLAASISDDSRSAMSYGDDLNLYPKGIEATNSGINGCPTTYHTRKDDLGNLDPRSVQDLGDSSLPLMRHFGSLDLKHTSEGKVVYFTFFGCLLFYPVTWVLPLTVFILTILGGILFLGFRRGRFTARGLGSSFLLWLAALLVSGGLVVLIWRALEALHLVNKSFLSAYNATPYGVGFVALATAIASGLFVWFRQKFDAANLAAGAFLLCTVPMVLTCFLAPNASFPFTWPLMAASLPMGLALVVERPDSWRLKVARLLGAAPALFLFPLFIGYSVTTLDGKMGDMIVLVILMIVLLALLAPQLDVLTARNRMLVPGTCALLAFGFILYGALSSGYNPKHPKPDTISYWLDTDTGKASWISFDQRPDNWTSQFLTGRVEASTLRLFNPVDGEAILKAEAPLVQFPAPSIETLEDSTTGGERKIRLRLVSPRQARILWLQLEKATVSAATVEGRKVQVNEVDKRNRVWGIVYLALPPEGIELDLTFNASESPQLTVIDQSDGLPNFPGSRVEPRPNDRMPLPVVWPYFDSTVLVSRTFPKLQQKNLTQPTNVGGSVVLTPTSKHLSARFREGLPTSAQKLLFHPTR
jgi:peptidase M28-like protein